MGPLALLVWFGTDHAGLGVPVEQAERHLVERGLRRRDLREDVDAVAVVLDHPFDPADLAFDALQPREELILGRRVAPGRYIGLRHATQSSTAPTP